MTNCPNCGAVINHDRYTRCPYCKTEYFDFTPMKVDEPFYIKLRDEQRKKTITAKVIMRTAEFKQEVEPAYGDFGSSRIIMTPNIHAEVGIRLLVLSENGRLYVVEKDEEENAE